MMAFMLPFIIANLLWLNNNFSVISRNFSAPRALLFARSDEKLEVFLNKLISVIIAGTH